MTNLKKDITKFGILLNYLERSCDRLVLACCHFEVWKKLKDLRYIDVLGEEKVEKNLETMNRYHPFFGLTIEAHRKIFILELFKFFDPNSKALSIKKIINFARSNKKYLTVNDFKSFNQNRDHLVDLLHDYDGIQECDLKDSEKCLKEIGWDIASDKILPDSKLFKLGKFRNQDLAHDQLKKENNAQNVLKGEDAEALFHCAEKILNQLSNKLNYTIYWNKNAIDDAKYSANLIVDHLVRFEPYRMKEIKNLLSRIEKKEKNKFKTT